MERRELEERIAGFPRWHYRFEFDNGATTPVFNQRSINRNEQRRRYFFDALLRVTGGSLRGQRVLDLGCNAGFWCLNAIEAEADFVLGVDGRQMHVDQARLVFEAKGIDPARYRFEQGNIFEHNFDDRFDVVLCLGLMYHIAKPVELFELMTRTGAEVIVIDTNIFPAPFSFFKVHLENVEAPWHAVDYEITLVPTRQAVIDLANQFGLKTVPLALNITDPAGMGDYREQRRLAFVCSRTA
ncbi:MAG: methyltransferase domain-containing protein, partial [Solirubrobacteraceae bacterium]